MRKQSSRMRVGMCIGLVLAGVLAVTGARKADAGVPSTQPVAGPLAGVEEIVFAVRRPGRDIHWYANFSHYATDPQRKLYTPGGRLCRLNLRTGAVVTLLEDSIGGVRDPQVHYEGRRILFSYRKGGSEYYHLYEIDADGKNLRQLTDGPFDDIEPTYLPDGGIVFCSSRCNRWVGCWMTRVAILYRCDADGGHIRAISTNAVHDNTPWPLPDGRILFTRWEYVDRSQVHYHHLWVKNPDGTGEMVFYGNQTPGTVMVDAKPIPGTNKVVAIFSPGHGRAEHEGRVTIVDPAVGPDEPSSARTINADPRFRDPYPFSEVCFLVAGGAELLLMDGQGNTRPIYRLPEQDCRAGLECHEPRPLLRHPRECAIPPKIDLAADTGVLVLANVYQGRNMAGVKPGEIKRLLLLEVLPKPINFSGGMEPLSYGGTFMLERVLGTVPVWPDGSARLEAPAMRSLVIAALDDQGRTVKRMQSFVSLMPGETVSCVGCHEQRTRAPANPGRGMLEAFQEPPHRIEPIAGVPDVLDFPRDVQPILDKHCVACHGYEATPQGGPRAGGLILTGDRGPVYSHSYYMLSVRQLLADGRNRARSNYPPHAFGSGASPLMNMIEPSHYQVRLSDRERSLIRLWLDTGAAYAGTYAALGTGMIGGYDGAGLDHSDTRRPAVIAAAEVLDRRCGSCHAGRMRLPDSPSDNLGMLPTVIRYGDARLRFSRHILYNLTRPEKSLLLLAPLAREAGGYGQCRAPGVGASDAPSAPVFADRTDPDYCKLLAGVNDAKNLLEHIRRFDMPGFHPREEYLRELREFGVYAGESVGHAVDVYATDQAYWRSLWWKPEGRSDPAE